MPPFLDPQSLSAGSILIALTITAALLVLVADWRLALFLLGIEYLLIAFLLTSLIHPSVAAVRVFSGGLAAAILYLTMRHRAEHVRRLQGTLKQEDSVLAQEAPGVFTVGLPFRLFAVALVAVLIIGLLSSVTLLGLPTFVLSSSLWLMAMGILTAMVSQEVLRLGVGVLVFLGGFMILDTALEASLFLYGLLNIADLLIALAVAHLATLPGEVDLQRRRGDLP